MSVADAVSVAEGVRKICARIEALEAERDMLRARLDECGCEHLRNLVSGPLDVVDGLMWVVSALDAEQLRELHRRLNLGFGGVVDG